LVVLKKSGWDQDLSPDEFASIEKISFRRHQARGAHAWLHASREFQGAVGRFQFTGPDLDASVITLAH
jgi:hypothetical protein